MHYGVPYQWGSNVLMYNTEVFKEAPTSWNVVFEAQDLPDGKPNTGRVQAFDGPIYIADAALYLMKHKPELGIKDPYELNEDQYKAALELLRAQRKIVSSYWHDAFVQIDDFTNEGFVASSSWPFQVNLLQVAEAADRLDRAGGRRDRLGRHHDDARRRARIRTAPTCGWSTRSTRRCRATSRAWFGSVPVMLAACKGNALLTDAGCDTNGLGNFDKIHFWRTPVGEVRDAGRCLRALLPLGLRLHRRARRALTRHDGSACDSPLP